MHDGPDKTTALLEAVKALRQAGIPHALIGGVAVGVHSGQPRATLDVDLAVLSTTPPETSVRVLTALGFHHKGTYLHSINFRHSSGEPVQLARDPWFDDLIGRAQDFTVGDTVVPIVTKEDLISMKERAAADPKRRASKRLQDQADVALLREGAPDPDEGW